MRKSLALIAAMIVLPAMAEVLVTEPADITPLDDRITANEGRLDALETQGGTAKDTEQDGRLDGHDQSIANHETEISDVQIQADSNESRVTSIEGETTTLDSRVGTLEAWKSVVDAQLSDHETRIEALEGGTPPQASIDGFVYARVKRTTEPVTVSGTTYEYTSVADRLIDVTRQGTNDGSGFFISAPGDLVWRKGDGTEVILHHCPEVALGETTCIAIDPRVSFDGKQVAYSVISGLYVEGPDVSVTRMLDPRSAAIHFVNLETLQKTQWPAVNNVFDMSPQWMPSGEIMFMSTRSHEYATSVYAKSARGEVLQLWLANADGTNARNISPDIQGDALHPVIHPNGKVLFSSWKRDLETAQNSTIDNKWYIAETRQDGSEHNAIWGAHARFLPNPDNITIKALHFMGVRSNGDLCTTDYYRQNNFGAGNVQCFTYPTPNHPEGKFAFKAKDGRYKALFGHSGDLPAEGESKARDPMGIPGGGLVFAASDPQYGCNFFHSLTEWRASQSGGCDFGIYVQDTIPEQSVASRTLVVNSPDWHEFQPQPVMPYEDIYGIEKPPVVKIDNPNPGGKCILRSASNRMQVDNEWGYFGPDDSRPCEEQGCSLAGLDKPSLMGSIKFWKVIPWPSSVRWQDFDSFAPVRMELLGTVPLQADGSFTAEVPCDTPFFMAGVDGKKRSLARDKIPMSLRPGETRTCSGCHNHDDDNPPQFENSDAASVTPTVLPANGTLLEWKADIWPMIQQCNANYPEIDFTQSNEQDVFTFFTSGYTGTAKPPWRSKWINWLFARESLLYWRALGTRVDGRTDADRTDDIDYGTQASVQKCMTDGQLETLANWIESGAYRQNSTW